MFTTNERRAAGIIAGGSLPALLKALFFEYICPTHKHPFMNSSRKWLVIAATALLAAACGSGGTEDETAGDSTAVDTVTSKQRMNTQIVFYNIPSPVETSQLLYDAGAEYDPAMVNDPLVYKSYITEESRAINLGVYGADLSFAGVFENAQESMSFLKCVNTICKDLGIAEAFDEKTAERLERNKDNRDSILDIVSKSFWEADGFLKENGRQNTSSLIVAGGWMEGMYIATKVYGKTKNDKIKRRLFSDPQRNSLNSLVALLESEKQSTESQFLLDGLKQLKAAYDKIPAGKAVTVAVTDTATHETRLETKNDVKVDEAVAKEIFQIVEDVRTKMIKTK